MTEHQQNASPGSGEPDGNQQRRLEQEIAELRQEIASFKQKSALSSETGESAIQKLSRFRKFAPSPFKEATDSAEAEEWLDELESILDALKTEEEDKMIYTEFLLQGEARIWWQMEKKKLEGKNYVWKDFQEKFLRRYFPPSECERRKREFLYLKQEDMTVMQYDRKFHKLSRFAKSIVGTEKDRVEQFLHGLRPTIQKDLAIIDFATHADALDKALKIEMAHEELEQYLKQKKRPNNQEEHNAQNCRQKVNDKNGKPSQLKEEIQCSKCVDNHSVDKCPLKIGVCFRCKKPGHMRKDCLVAKGACFHCKRQGHIAVNYPEKTAQN